LARERCSYYLRAWLDVTSADPLTYSVILSSMLLVILAASFDPVEAIRRE
jgi:hypothetical protein